MENKVEEGIRKIWLEACENGHAVSFKIASGSMRPFIEIGDTVKVRRVKLTEIHTGDIVAFKQGGHVIVHRIMKVRRNNGKHIFLQIADVGGISRPVTSDNIIGKVVAIGKNGLETDLTSTKQIIGNRLFGWRAMMIDQMNRKQAYGVSNCMGLIFKPLWRLCRHFFLLR